MNIDPKRVQACFLAALDVEDPTERRVLLDRECEADHHLRKRVDALLRAYAAPDSFLDQSSEPREQASLLQPGEPGSRDRTLDFDTPTSVHKSQSSNTQPFPLDGTSAPPTTPLSSVAGRYRCLEKLGEGGMGEVWVAKQSEPVKRRVALKLIKSGMDSKAVLQRFEQERQALAMMDHPNIARVFDGGVTQSGQPFFAMELVNGLPITEFCDEAKLSLLDRLAVFAAVCRAIQHAHQKGVVHRDLKPANVLVTLIDGQPVPKVIDFGVAKAIGGKLTEATLDTHFGAVVGTLEYMAPEQAGYSGVDVDTRADIYSLGVILYELLTGLRPFDMSSFRSLGLAEIIKIITEEEPTKPSARLSTSRSIPATVEVRSTDVRKLTNTLRGELDWVVMKCLEKQRERRYQTANALLRDIERFMAGKAVEARPPTTSYLVQKFLRRHRGSVATASLVLLALCFGLAGTTLGFIRARGAEQQTRMELNRSEEIKQLLSGMLRSVSPREMQAMDTTLLRKLLADTSIRLQTGKIEDPLIAAELQQLIGEVYLDLADVDNSEAHIIPAHETRLRLLGARDRRTLQSNYYRARVLAYQGKLLESIAMHQDVWELRMEVLGPTHRDTLESHLRLVATRLAFEGDAVTERSLHILDQAVQLAESHYGSNDVLTALAKTMKADQTKDQRLSLPIRKEVYHAYAFSLGPNHPDTIRSMTALARTHARIEEYDRFLEISGRAIEIAENGHGVDAYITMATKSDIANAMSHFGMDERALAIFEPCLTIFTKDRVPEVERVLHYERLARFLYRQGRLEESMILYQELYPLVSDVYGSGHHFFMDVTSGLTRVYEALGQHAEAGPFRKQWQNVALNVVPEAAAESPSFGHDVIAPPPPKDPYIVALDGLSLIAPQAPSLHVTVHESVLAIRRRTPWLLANWTREMVRIAG